MLNGICGEKNSGINGLKKILSDVDIIINKEIDEGLRTIYVENLYASIFHKLSWGRIFFH